MHPICGALGWGRMFLLLTLGQYPPAQGCHSLLNRWCSSNCPRPGARGDGNPLLARRLPLDADGKPRWGCYPQSELQSDDAPHFAKLVDGSAAKSFCGPLSTPLLKGLEGNNADEKTREQGGLNDALASAECVRERERFFNQRAEREQAARRAANAARQRALASLRRGVAVPLTKAHEAGHDATCGRATAYASVLTVSHRSVRGNTFMARLGDGATGADAASSDDAFAARQLAMQAGLLLTLIRSVRSVERCRRDYVVLLGCNITLPLPMRRAFQALNVTFHRVEQLCAIRELERAARHSSDALDSNRC